MPQPLSTQAHISVFHTDDMSGHPGLHRRTTGRVLQSGVGPDLDGRSEMMDQGQRAPNEMTPNAASTAKIRASPAYLSVTSAGTFS